jgi:hypothetical protein
MASGLGYPGLPDERFGAAKPVVDFVSEYDQDPGEMADAQRRGRPAVQRFTLDLTSLGDAPTGSTIGFKTIECPGRAFCLFGWTTGDEKRAVKNTFLTMVAIDDDSMPVAQLNAGTTLGDARYPSNSFPAKHGRGYNGSFKKLRIFWPIAAHTAQSVDVMIYRSIRDPWMMDQST